MEYLAKDVETWNKSRYRITIEASIKTNLDTNIFLTKVSYIDEKYWLGLDVLFFSYIGRNTSIYEFIERENRSSWQKELSQFGKNFKHSIISPYIGLWMDNIDLAWDDILSVKIEHIDENGKLFNVNLPFPDKIFKTEDKFYEAFEEEFHHSFHDILEKANKYPIKYLTAFDLDEARYVLRCSYKYEDYEIQSLFWREPDNGFGFLYEEKDKYQYISKNLNIWDDTKTCGHILKMTPKGKEDLINHYKILQTPSDKFIFIKPGVYEDDIYLITTLPHINLNWEENK